MSGSARSAAAPLLIPRPGPGLLSLVLPIYNEEETIPLLRKRLDGLVKGLPCPVEVILVNDGSADGSLGALLGWARESEIVSVISLSRNFGHQAAATAGLDHATGDAIVLMDADLQDPPELVHEMLAGYRSGYDVVYAQRKTRLGENRFKRLSAWLFYRIMQVTVDMRLPPDTGDYRLISRECLDALRLMREQHRFLRGMVAWAGFPQKAVLFVRQPRAAGETKYPLSKMIRFGWTAATSFSATPLRIVFGMGLLVALLGAGAGVYSVAARLLGYYVVPGWTSLMIMQSLIGCFILVSLGVIGEYVAKIYEEAKDRPIYLLDTARSYRRQMSTRGQGTS